MPSSSCGATINHLSARLLLLPSRRPSDAASEPPHQHLPPLFLPPRLFTSASNAAMQPTNHSSPRPPRPSALTLLWSPDTSEATLNAGIFCSIHGRRWCQACVGPESTAAELHRYVLDFTSRPHAPSPPRQYSSPRLSTV